MKKKFCKDWTSETEAKAAIQELSLTVGNSLGTHCALAFIQEMWREVSERSGKGHWYYLDMLSYCVFTSVWGGGQSDSLFKYRKCTV